MIYNVEPNAVRLYYEMHHTQRILTLTIMILRETNTNPNPNPNPKGCLIPVMCFFPYVSVRMLKICVIERVYVFWALRTYTYVKNASLENSLSAYIMVGDFTYL